MIIRLNIFLVSIIFVLSVHAAGNSEEAPQTTIFELTAFVDSAYTLCSKLAPESNQALWRAILDWRTANGISVIDDIITTSIHVDNNKLALIFSNMKRENSAKLHDRVAKRAKVWCAQFPKHLKEHKWQLDAQYPEAMDKFRSITNNAIKKIIDVLPAGEPLAAVAPVTYQSMIDSEIKPARDVAPDEFRCYRKKSGQDHRWPELLIQFNEKGHFRSTFGDGSYQAQPNTIVWRGGPFLDKSKMSYDRHGQSFSVIAQLNGRKHQFSCYQQGASDRRAQILFALAKPDPGQYHCNSQKSPEGIVELLDEMNYQLLDKQGVKTGQKGIYRVEGILGKASPSSKIVWISGPLAKGDSSVYSEYVGSGVRKIQLTTSYSAFVMGSGGSGKSLRAECSQKAEPLTLPEYGALPAPAPPDEAGGLEGMYAYITQGNASESGGRTHYITFFPEGYIYRGIPLYGSVTIDQCRKTLPNGKPFCEIYSQDNGVLQIIGSDPVPFEKRGNSIVLGKNTYVLIPTQKMKYLEGRYSYARFKKWGTFDLGGSSFYEQTYRFTREGKFSINSRSQTTNTSSFYSAPAAIYSGSNNSNNKKGSYEIDGHTLTLRFENGGVSRHLLTVTKEGRQIYIDGKGYSKQKTTAQ